MYAEKLLDALTHSKPTALSEMYLAKALGTTPETIKQEMLVLKKQGKVNQVGPFCWGLPNKKVERPGEANEMLLVESNIEQRLIDSRMKYDE